MSKREAEGPVVGSSRSARLSGKTEEEGATANEALVAKRGGYAHAWVDDAEGACGAALASIEAAHQQSTAEWQPPLRCRRHPCRPEASA